MAACGVDTSVLVRLATGHPEEQFEQTVASLTKLLERGEFDRLEAGTLVIAEAYFALQHHYRIEAVETRQALHSVLTSGLVHAARGEDVLHALTAHAEPGFIDRLVRIEDAHESRPTLTLDRKMARLPGCRRLT